MGRKPSGKYNIKKLIKIFREYTESAQLPILKEVCFDNDLDYDYIIQLQRENPELGRVTRRLLMKKEIQLEKALMTGANNTAFIFQLKQLGWKDQPEPLLINNTINNNQGGNRSDKLKQCSTETLETLEEIYAEIDEESKKQSEAEENDKAKYKK